MPEISAKLSEILAILGEHVVLAAVAARQVAALEQQHAVDEHSLKVMGQELETLHQMKDRP